jgi:Sec-independent protein translocase protein TatA
VPTWLIIVIVVLILLAAGGIIARTQQLKRSRPAFERNLAQVERDLVAAAAADRGWNREHLEAAARRIGAEQLGSEPEELTLIEVLDRPGTDEDEAVFDVRAGGKRHRLVLGRKDGDWVAGSR